MAYQAWLGFYNSVRELKWSKPELVANANRYALECLLLPEIPALEPKTVGKMGLKGVPGLRIERFAGGDGGGGGGKGGGGGGGGRGGGGGGGGGKGGSRGGVVARAGDARRRKRWDGRVPVWASAPRAAGTARRAGRGSGRRPGEAHVYS